MTPPVPAASTALRRSRPGPGSVAGPDGAAGSRATLRGGAGRSGAGRMRAAGDDSGFGSVEVVLLVPVLVLALLLVVAVGRVEQARLQVTGAARDATRAASLTRSPVAAQAAAAAAVDVALTAGTVTCSGGPTVSVDVSRFEPGGVVQVDVACAARLGDLGFPGLPATKTLTASASSPLEQYRSQP